MKDLVHKNRVTILEIATRFYVQNHLAFCHQNRVMAAKIAARFDSIRSKKQLFQKCDFNMVLPQKSQLWSLYHPKWIVTLFMGSLYNKTSETSHGNIINNIKQHHRAIYQVLKPNSKNHHFQSNFHEITYVYIAFES